MKIIDRIEDKEKNIVIYKLQPTTCIIGENGETIEVKEIGGIVYYEGDLEENLKDDNFELLEEIFEIERKAFSVQNRRFIEIKAKESKERIFSIIEEYFKYTKIVESLQWFDSDEICEWVENNFILDENEIIFNISKVEEMLTDRIDIL